MLARRAADVKKDGCTYGHSHPYTPLHIRIHTARCLDCRTVHAHATWIPGGRDETGGRGRRVLWFVCAHPLPLVPVHDAPPLASISSPSQTRRGFQFDGRSPVIFCLAPLQATHSLSSTLTHPILTDTDNKEPCGLSALLSWQSSLWRPLSRTLSSLPATSLRTGSELPLPRHLLRLRRQSP